MDLTLCNQAVVKFPDFRIEPYSGKGSHIESIMIGTPYFRQYIR
jgi:hypothetical protein